MVCNALLKRESLGIKGKSKNPFVAMRADRFLVLEHDK